MWLISTIIKHTLYVMSTPILAPKDAHVILSKVTANTMLIHDVLPSNKLSFIYTVFKVA